MNMLEMDLEQNESAMENFGGGVLKNFQQIDRQLQTLEKSNYKSKGRKIDSIRQEIEESIETYEEILDKELQEAKQEEREVKKAEQKESQLGSAIGAKANAGKNIAKVAFIGIVAAVALIIVVTQITNPF